MLVYANAVVLSIKRHSAFLLSSYFTLYNIELKPPAKPEVLIVVIICHVPRYAALICSFASSSAPEPDIVSLPVSRT